MVECLLSTYLNKIYFTLTTIWNTHTSECTQKQKEPNALYHDLCRFVVHPPHSSLSLYKHAGNMKQFIFQLFFLLFRPYVYRWLVHNFHTLFLIYQAAWVQLNAGFYRCPQIIFKSGQTATKTDEWLTKTVDWLRRSCDLNPLDYFLRGYIKSIDYRLCELKY